MARILGFITRNTNAGVKILVTGAAGHLARVVLQKFCENAAVERVIALDRRPIDFSHQKIEPRHADLAAIELESLLQNCDALVHLAWTVMRGRTGAQAMYANNVGVGKKLFAAAAQAGVRRLIHVSSAAVYGNGSMLNEQAPLAPLAGFLYAEHKAEFETWLTREVPEAIVLRPHIILGPNALPLLKTMLSLPMYTRLAEPQPLLQCVHEQDVAEAIILALHSAHSGPFNLAAADTFDYRDMIRARHPRAISIPYPLTRMVLYGAWRLFGIGAEPGWLAGMRDDLTLDCGRARQLLGWQPRWSSRDTLQQTARTRAFSDQD